MLKYIGNGNFIPGIPARDLSDEEVEKHGGEKILVTTGLYEKLQKSKPIKYKEKEGE